MTLDTRHIMACSLASEKKSTCMARLQENVMKVEQSHEILTLSLKENVMHAYLCGISHFQMLTRNLVSAAQKM